MPRCLTSLSAPPAEDAEMKAEALKLTAQYPSDTRIERCLMTAVRAQRARLQAPQTRPLRTSSSRN